MSRAVIPPGVIDAIRSKNAVLFVGAGVSVDAGLPSASALASSLLTTLANLGVSVYGREPRLDEVAELFQVKLGRVRLATEIEALLSTTTLSDIGATHLLIAFLIKHGFVDTVVTTNYDSLIEDACTLVGTRIKTISHPSLMYHSSGRAPVIFKLHGDFHHPELLVLTPRDYHDFESHTERRPIITRIRELVQSRPVIFVGYSVQDASFLRLFEQMRAELPDSGRPQSYAGVFDTAGFDEAEERLSQYGIKAFLTPDLAETFRGIISHLNVKLRIAHLIFHYPLRYGDSRALYGGIETFYELVKKFSEHDHELLEVLTAKMYHKTPQEWREPEDLIYPASYYTFRAATTATVHELLVRRRTGERLPDVVHVHFLGFADRVQDAGFPTLCTSHSLLSTDLAFTRGVFDGAARPGVISELKAVRKAERRSCEELQHINVFSESHRNELLQLGATDIALIKAPFDPEPFLNYDRTTEAARKSINLPEQCPTVTYVGRPDRRKGLEVLLGACSILREADVVFQILIVGFGFDYDEEDHRLGFALNRFSIDTSAFTGRGGKIFLYSPGTHPSTLAPCYAASDIVVVPSIYEPMGYVVLEAMASARAVVGSETGGIPEILTHGETGLLFQPGDVNELASVIGTLLANPELRSRLGDNGRKAILSRENPTQSVQRLDHLYTEVAFGVDYGARQFTVSPEMERRIDESVVEAIASRRLEQLQMYDVGMLGCVVAGVFSSERQDERGMGPLDVALLRTVANRIHRRLRASAQATAFRPEALFEVMCDITLSYLNREEWGAKPIELSAERTRDRLSIENWVDLNLPE
jgi:glycosyltransferase involved in cell wall biosynthesis